MMYKTISLSGGIILQMNFKFHINTLNASVKERQRSLTKGTPNQSLEGLRSFTIKTLFNRITDIHVYHLLLEKILINLK